MEQEYVTINETVLDSEDGIHDALTRCKNCHHIVPKTMLCLYCGSPILYKHPQKE